MKFLPIILWSNLDFYVILGKLYVCVLRSVEPRLILLTIPMPSKFSHFFFYWVISAMFFSVVSGQDLTQDGNTSAKKKQPPKIERVGSGVYRVEDILLDKNRNQVSFPAVVNQVHGLVEYGIVHENGKTHESLFRTKTRPIHLNFVLLLSKLKPAKGFIENLWAEKPKPMDLRPHTVAIEVSWDFNGSKGIASLGSLALNDKDDQPIGPNSFVFTGSKFLGGDFQAESTGSILAVYADDTSMINSSDYDSNNDDVWYANKKALPGLETPVVITFKLPNIDPKPKPLP